MTVITIPNRPAGTDQRSIELILADFDAITDVVNGGLDATNMSAAFLATFASGTALSAPSGNVNALPGNTYVMGGGHTVTLPAATGLGALPVDVWANGSASGASPVTVTCSENIFGEGYEGTTWLIGTQYKSVRFLPDGPGSVWFAFGEFDSGWKDITPNCSAGIAPDQLSISPYGLTGPTEFRKKGNELEFQGGLTNTTSGSITLLATLPTLYHPINSEYRTIDVYTSGAPNRAVVFFGTDGTIEFIPGVGGPSTVLMDLNGIKIPLI